MYYSHKFERALNKQTFVLVSRESPSNSIKKKKVSQIQLIFYSSRIEFIINKLYRTNGTRVVNERTIHHLNLPPSAREKIETVFFYQFELEIEKNWPISGKFYFLIIITKPKATG